MKREKVLLIGFALSTMCALIYEVVWSRQLTYIFGTSVYAISTVLTSFMFGLSLGSYLFGNLADKTSNLTKLFAMLEIGIGIYGILSLSLFKIIPNAYHFMHHFLGETFFFHYMQFLLSFLVLLIPTIFIGGTFSVMSKLYTKKMKELGKTVGIVYSLDSLGAAVGAFAAGILLIPFFGYMTTIMVAATINLLIGTTILSLYSDKQPVKKIKAPVSIWSLKSFKRFTIFDKIIFFSFYLSGFAALTYEIIWTRLLSLTFGTGAYAFSVMLVAYFTGLALGSYIMSHLIDNIDSPIIWLIIIQLSIGLCGLLLLPGFSHLDIPYLAVVKWATSPYFIMASWILIPFLLLIPTMLMGATLPLVTKMVSHQKENIGTDVGLTYSATTLGGIFGAWWTGFILIPYIGIEKTVVIAAVCNISAAILLFYFYKKTIYIFCEYIPTTERESYSFYKRQRKNFRRIKNKIYIGIAIALVMSAYFTFYTMNPAYAGVYYVAKTTSIDLWRDIKSEQNVLYNDETLYGFLEVKDLWGSRLFSINGKVEASTGHADLTTQFLLAYLPLMVHKNPKNVLNIGFGTGSTLGVVTNFPVSKITCIEIDPMVVDVAGRYFSDYNNDVLDDPRTEIIVEDARNYLMSHDETYDVIISDPQDVWNSGASPLFTREFYLTIRDRLNDDGIFTQYITSIDYTPDDFQVLLNTMHEAFPYLNIWETPNTLIIMGSLDPMILNYDSLRHTILENPDIKKDFMFMARSEDDDSVVDFFIRSFVMGEDEIEEFIRDAGVNTDDKPILEYSTIMNLLVHNTDPITEIIRFKKERWGKSLAVPKVGVTQRRIDSRLVMDFLNLEATVDEWWRPVFSGYEFTYVPDRHSIFPPGYSKQGAKYAAFEKGQLRLYFDTIPLRFLSVKADDIGQAVNLEVKRIAQDSLMLRGQDMVRVEEILIQDSVGYKIFGESEGETSRSITLIWYCDHSGHIHVVTGDYVKDSQELDTVIDSTRCIRHT